MPSPVAHTLAAIAVRQLGPARSQRSAVLTTAILIVLANLADVDFIPGYLKGDPRAFHWSATHSLLAIAVAATAAGMAARACRQDFRFWFVLGGLTYGSHVLFDSLLGSGAPSMGLQLFWPFSSDRYMARFQVFRMAPPIIAEDPIRALFSMEMLPLLVREALILMPVIVSARVIGQAVHVRRARRIHASHPQYVCDAHSVATTQLNAASEPHNP